MLHLAWIVPLTLLVFYVASPRYRGEIAQARVRRILSQGLEKNRYTVLNGLTVPAGGGTVLIDHVVVSKFGIFVIDSVFARGWISGTAVQDRWKRHHLFRNVRFNNPVHRNRLQAEALATLLGYPERVFHCLVVFCGHRGFKRDPPQNVVQPEQLIRLMRKKAEQQLDAQQAAAALQKIGAARLDKGSRRTRNRVFALQAMLLFVLAGGLYLAFGEHLRDVYDRWATRSEMRANPDAFHPDGRPKTERDLWLDSLRCAWSPDTQRCACYEPEGKRVDLDTAECRKLAERGSILQR